MNPQVSVESKFPAFDSSADELWVVQRRVYSRDDKSTWKTITNPMPYGQAFDKLHEYPSETTRLMAGIKEYSHLGAMQREI